jgi:ubiquinone/menaquinone biosynthesis C-methylase UbiE
MEKAYAKAEMFNKKAKKWKSRPDQVVEVLSLQSGQNIADLGSGGGYFSMRFSNKVGTQGKIYALDTNADFLNFIEENVKEQAIQNIKTAHIKNDKIEVPLKSIDLFFVRSVYHHLSNRPTYFKKLGKFLKDDGRIAIIEYTKKGFFSFHKLFGHNVPKEIIIKEMTEAGYHIDTSFDFLPYQSFTIFKK